MPTPREFFLSEARDCLKQLHAVLRTADDSIVDAAELHRVSRVLRGSAQMAREPRVQAVARALELAGRALVQGALAWGEDLRGEVERTLQDLTALVEADGTDAQLDERAAAAIERWERKGLEVTAPPGPGTSPWSTEPAAAPLDPGAVPVPGEASALGVAHAPGDVAALDGAPAHEELPIEVVNFFRSEAGALVDRIERMVGERPQWTGDRSRAAQRELRDTVTALRDLAATFGFSAATAGAERLLDALDREDPVDGLVAELRRLVTSEVPGRPVPPAGSTEPARPEAPAPDRTPAATALSAGEQDAVDVVPIEDLLYRGEAALRRALELRPAIERLAGTDAAARETVDELFDLIRLGLS